MNKKREKTRAGKALAVTLSCLLMALGIVTAIPQEAHAAGSGEVILGNYTELNFRAQKTIDLTNSSIDITLTQGEKNQIDAEADQSTLAWMYKVIAMENDNRDVPPQPNYWDYNGDREKYLNDYNAWTKEVSWVKAYGLHERYWYDSVDISGLQLDQDAKNIVDKVKSYGDLSSFLALSDSEIGSLLGDNVKIFADDVSELRKVLQYKKVEIKNDKQSDVLVSKIASKLPVTVDFSVETIGEDEAEKYGIDGSDIKAGSLQGGASAVPLSTVNFGSQDQFYDEVLNKEIRAYVESNDTTGMPSGDVISDGKEILTHLILIDGAELVSSDDSQTGGGIKRGDPDYPGMNYLLEFGDPLEVYTWARYGMPGGGGYVGTFDLALNPAVTYSVHDIKEDLITDIQFDDSGKVQSVSKSLATEKEWTDFLANKLGNNTGAKTYRYKIVETSVAPNELGSDRFYKNTETKILDVNWNGTAVVVRDDPKDTGDLSHATFTNYPDKPTVVEKTIEGGSDLKLETLDQAFTYRISTNLPKGASTFVIEDNLEKVLEFADPSKTTVKIGGKDVTAEEKEAMLSQSAGTLKVELDRELIEKYGGQTIAVEFSCKLKDGADLSSYEDRKVPNVANVIIDNEFTTKSETEPTVTPPNDAPPSETPPVETEKTKAPGKVSRVNTGDEMPLSPALLAMLMVVSLIAILVTVWRRKGAIH